MPLDAKYVEAMDLRFQVVGNENTRLIPAAIIT
jgi:hypothetical protein